jgi:DNA segregation ATPase FtsK/SpoIIIE-like protein
VGKRKVEEPISDAAIEAPRHKGLEALGVGLVLGALALCFALFSFDPDGGHGNLVGPLGDGIARLILGGIGAVGYVVGLFAIGVAGATLLGRVRFPTPLTIGSLFSVTLGATILAHLIVEPDILGHPAGGIVGVVASTAIATVAGPAGTALFGVGAVLVGVLGIADVSIGRAVTDAYALARLIARFASGKVGIWLQARGAGKRREEELVESARSRRATERIAAIDRERALEAELEEQARMAVLKATAKAEQKALAKIAAEEARERIERQGEAAGSDGDGSSEELGDVVEVALGIPGPGAEPEIVIPSGIEDVFESADVIDEIDRASRIGRARVALDEDEVDEDDGDEDDGDEDEVDEDDADEGEVDEDDFDEDEVDEDDADEDDGDEDDGDEDDGDEDDALEAGEEDEDGAEDGEDIRIHDRLELETSFEEAPVEEVRREFHLPPINLLDYEGDPPEPVNGELLRLKAARLEEKLRTYGVEGRVTAIRPGPVVTTYEYQPAPGVKVSKIANLCDDIAMSMEALRVRIVAPIPGRGVVGIELPNERRENVYLKELIAHDSFKKSRSPITLALGKDAEGNPIVRDLRKMPHLLIAGTTGSGKSVSINTMILSVLYKATPDQVKFIMVDPKMLELSLYNDIPHLLLPVVTDPRKASLALAWAVDEMERRYQLLSDAKVRDIDGFNKRIEKLEEKRAEDAERAKLGEDVEEVDDPQKRKKLHDPWRGQELPKPLPYIVVLIDEFADLMCVAPRDVESAVQRLAQKARAAGIHVLLATQRPSTDVITGVIKNNFPSRISFRVASRHDSGTILNSPGAENLLGMGDSLVLDVASPVPERVHGGFVSEHEVERVVEFWKAQAKPEFDNTILERRDGDEPEIAADEMDEMYDTAVRIVGETKKASISALQRRLRVGYNRAARMVEMMEMQGIVGPAIGPKGEREVLIHNIGADGPPRS